MKKYFFYCLICFTNLSATAQAGNAESVNKTVFLFPEFISGEVLSVNGSRQETLLNYNTLFQQMIFQQNGVMMALDHIAAIDTVFIDSRKFIPVDTFFYEIKMEHASIPLFIRHSCTVSRAAPATPFGGNSQTGAVQTLSSYRLGLATPYQLKIPDNYMVNPGTEFLIKSNGQFIRLKGIKQFANLFPGEKRQSKDFIENNHIHFSKETDVEKLLQCCGQLK